MHRWLARALPFLGDRACFLCLGPTREEMLCARCTATLPWLPDARCPRCALPTAAPGPCRRCRLAPRAFDATLVALEYRFPVDRIIHALKYGRRLPVAAWCADRLRRAVVAAADVDSGTVLVPMPASRERLKVRGFDHATEIARALAPSLGMRCAERACVRLRERPSQATLRWRDRAHNLEGVFRCERLPSARVAIIDDVVTTGASAHALATALRAAGATRVEVWAVARTPAPTARR